MCNEGKGHGALRWLYTCKICNEPVHGALAGCSGKGAKGDYASHCVCTKCKEQTPKVHTTCDHTDSLRAS